MESLEGVTNLHMSGARAVFDTESGAKIEELQVALAFEKQGMKLESFEEAWRPRPRGSFVIDAGIT